jgi:hypothetical protein
MNATDTMNIFVDYHPTAEEPTIEQQVDFTNDSGGMNSDIADNYAKLKHAAMQIHDKKSYQWNTKNKSFIDLHKDLKTLGVKNNKFFLALYDKTLENVDPFAPVVPLELQARVAREVIRNPWYYLREIARIPMDGKPIVPGGGSPFIIDRNSAATWYLFLNGIDTYASKPRQCGKTQDAIAKINYAYNFGSLAATITLANKDLTLNKMNLARLKAQRDMLPVYLQAKNIFDIATLKILKETSNVTSMKNPVTNNNIILLPTANSEAKADGLGRGYTSSIQLWDEFDWTPYNTKIIDCSVFAFNTASANAKTNKSLYGRLFTSTPGNIDSRDGQSAEEFINGNQETGARGMLKWNDTMFDMDIRKLYNVVHSPKSYNGIVFVEHTWQQLKKSYDWYEKACEGVRYNPEVIAREINLKRLRGTSKSPFKRTDIMYLISNMLTAKETVDYSDNLSPIYIYDKIERRTPYILVVDPAEGLSGDNMAMSLINPYTEKAVAEFETPYITQPKMAKMIVKFMDNYCPKSVIVVENNKGRELLHLLQESKYAANIWYDIDKLGDKESIDKREVDTSAEKALGFNTNTKTRPILFGILENMVSEEPDKLNAKLLVDSICALERTRTGRIEAAQGKHDDMVMAYLIGICVRRMSSNMEDYGIIPGNIDPLEKAKQPLTVQEKLNKLKELIETLPEAIRNQFNMVDKATADAANYRKELDIEIAKTNLKESYAKQTLGEEDDYMLDHPSSYYDAALDKDLDDIIGYGATADKDFDINDWI